LTTRDSHATPAPLSDPEVSNRALHDGRDDGLEPLESLDCGAVQTFDEMLEAMARTAFGGRRMGESAEVLADMVTDPDCSVVLTLSGAMTVAKMGLVITEMIERGWVQAIVSTGALMTHGLVELAGMEHYKARDGDRDAELFDKGYNRVYDTYEQERNLNQLQALMVEVFARMPTDRTWASWELCRETGRVLDQPGSRGIMAAAARAGVPIYIPAFSDSELGLDFATWLLEARMRETGQSAIELLPSLSSPFDPFRDLGHYSRFVVESPRLGIFTIGGGVPRNWAQQAPPFVDLLNHVVGVDNALHRFRYGVRICPEPVHWGGLSGCTYSEGVSWGKFVPPSEGGRFAEVFADATIAWPVLVKGVAERLDRLGRSASAPRVALAGFPGV
jgi:deoxyhypusine synthase